MYNTGLEITVGKWTLTNGDVILSYEILLLLGTMTNNKIFEKFMWEIFCGFIEHLKQESFCTILILTNFIKICPF